MYVEARYRTETMTSFSSILLSQLLLNVRSTQALRRRIVRVLQVLCIDTRTVGSIANTVTVDAHIKSLRDPAVRNATTEPGRQTPDVARRSAAVVINIAGQTRLVKWVTDQEHALDSVEVSACELGHGVDGGRGALGVALEDEALVGGGAQGAGDLVDNVLGAEGGVLREIGRVDGVIDLATAEGRCDARVHCPETSGGALDLACAAGVDDGVGRAGGGGCALLLEGDGEGAREEREDGEKS